MNKLLGGTLVLALAAFAAPAPQTSTPAGGDTQTAKKTAKKHRAKHAKHATAAQPQK